MYPVDLEVSHVAEKSRHRTPWKALGRTHNPLVVGSNPTGPTMTRRVRRQPRRLRRLGSDRVRGSRAKLMSGKDGGEKGRLATHHSSHSHNLQGNPEIQPAGPLDPQLHHRTDLQALAAVHKHSATAHVLDAPVACNPTCVRGSKADGQV